MCHTDDWLVIPSADGITSQVPWVSTKVGIPPFSSLSYRRRPVSSLTTLENSNRLDPDLRRGDKNLPVILTLLSVILSLSEESLYR